MSYSYIKSVFPNFENSNKEYDESVYNGVVRRQGTFTEGTFTEGTKNEIGSNVMVNLSDFSKTLSQNNQVDLPQEKLIESYRNVEGMTNGEYAEIKPRNPTDTRNNLKYYNKPLSTLPTTSPSIYKSKEEKDIFEKFTDDMNCDLYVKHVIQCNRCKMMAMKTFGVETDRIRNEEIMELISYILFGLFVLMLIDSSR
jgi:hypothetical protein